MHSMWRMHIFYLVFSQLYSAYIYYWQSWLRYWLVLYYTSGIKKKKSSGQGLGSQKIHHVLLVIWPKSFRTPGLKLHIFIFPSISEHITLLFWDHFFNGVPQSSSLGPQIIPHVPYALIFTSSWHIFPSVHLSNVSDKRIFWVSTSLLGWGSSHFHSCSCSSSPCLISDCSSHVSFSMKFLRVPFQVHNRSYFKLSFSSWSHLTHLFLHPPLKCLRILFCFCDITSWLEFLTVPVSYFWFFFMFKARKQMKTKEKYKKGEKMKRNVMYNMVENTEEWKVGCEEMLKYFLFINFGKYFPPS